MVQSRLEVGGVVREVWRIYVDQAPVLMPAAAVVFAISGVLSGALVAASSGLALVAALISLVAGTLFTGMVVELVADVQDGRRDARPGQLLRAATPVLGQLLLVGLVAGVVVLIGLIALIVPGLILITVWSVAAPVVVLERPPGLRALGRSRELVRGNGWQTFGVIALLVVFVYAVASALEIVGESAGTGVEIVVRVIVGVLAAPLSALAAAVLYFALLKAHGEGRRTAAAEPPAPNPFGSG
jgi:hypothetical protein